MSRPLALAVLGLGILTARPAPGQSLERPFQESLLVTFRSLVDTLADRKVDVDAIDLRRSGDDAAAVAIISPSRLWRLAPILALARGAVESKRLPSGARRTTFEIPVAREEERLADAPLAEAVDRALAAIASPSWSLRHCWFDDLSSSVGASITATSSGAGEPLAVPSDASRAVPLLRFEARGPSTSTLLGLLERTFLACPVLRLRRVQLARSGGSASLSVRARVAAPSLATRTADPSVALPRKAMLEKLRGLLNGFRPTRIVVEDASGGAPTAIFRFEADLPDGKGAPRVLVGLLRLPGLGGAVHVGWRQGGPVTFEVSGRLLFP